MVGRPLGLPTILLITASKTQEKHDTPVGRCLTLGKV